MGLIHLHLTLSCVSPCEVTFHSQAFHFICIGGVMVSVLAWSVVDCGFIGGVMFSVLAWSVVDCGFIGGVMVSVLASSLVDCEFIGGVMVSVLASSVVVWIHWWCNG